jgi:hypothetical protein
MEEQTNVPEGIQPPPAEVERPIFSNYLRSASAVLSRTSSELRGMELPALATFADQGASWLQDLAQFSKDHGIEQRVSELSGVARRRPELFIGGLLLAGYALSRGIRGDRA